MNLKPPKDWRKGITKAMGELLGEKRLEDRIQEIQAIITRMDQRWDHGFILNEEEYIQQRIQMQMELEKLTPVLDDELQQAADLLENFKAHWDRLEGDEEARHELVRLIVERVYVRDEQIVAMTLRSNYHLVLNHKTKEPTEFSVDSSFVTSGSDGHGSRRGCSTVIMPINSNHPAIVRYLLKNLSATPSCSINIKSQCSIAR